MAKKPLLVALSDTHVVSDNTSLVYDIFKQAADLCEELGITTLVHDGDWFNDRSAQSLACLLNTRNVLKMLERRKIDVYTLEGNHDKTNLSSEFGYMTLYSEHKNLSLQDEESVVSYNHNGKTYLLCFLSYFPEGVDYLSRLNSLIQKAKKIDKKAPKILFTHTAINGVKNNDGSLVSGDIEAEYFDFFDLVIVGHYHDRQEISDKILYLGSAYQRNFGENEEKGFMILYDDLTWEFRKASFPVFKKVYVSADKPEVAAKMVKKMEGFIKDNKLRVIFTGDQSDVEKIKSTFTAQGVDVRFESKQTEVKFEDVEDAEVIVHSRSTFLKSWGEYANITGLSVKEKAEGIKLITSKMNK